MKKMLITSLFVACFAAPLLAVEGVDKCGCSNKPRPNRGMRPTTQRPAADAQDKCGCNNKPRPANTKGCGSCCNTCNSCNNKPCCK